MVPKIIHYCWLSNDPIPEKLIKCMETWHNYLPEYEFILWNTKRFDINSVKWVEQAFNAKKYAFASDYIRFYAIYYYGGIYLDMDMEVLQPFDDSLFTHGLNFGLEDGGGIEGAFIAGEKGHPILRELMDWYENNTFIQSDGSFKMVVVNAYIQKILSKYGYAETSKGQVLPDCNVRLYEKEYFSCRSLLTGKINRTKNSYIIHWHSVLWANRSTRIIAWLRMNILVPLLGDVNYRRIQRFFHRGEKWTGK